MYHVDWLKINQSGEVLKLNSIKIIQLEQILDWLIVQVIVTMIWVVEVGQLVQKLIMVLLVKQNIFLMIGMMEHALLIIMQ